MPSVFPGMDPFLEGEEWEDFHSRFITAFADTLTPNVRPEYAVRTEKRVFVESNDGEKFRQIRPDVAVLRDPHFNGNTDHAASTLVTVAPIERTLPAPLTIEEKYLVIRRLDSNEVVTVIELLSPANKRPGIGQDAYLEKREEILQSATHLVEIDLLRGGSRMPTMEGLPAADYFVFVCRRRPRHKAAVYPWPLNHRLPAIPIPLAGDDPDVMLDLQAVFNGVYDRAGYDYSVNYKRQLTPPVSEAEAKWVSGLLSDQG